ncbi:MAG: type II toxin-antitoxin system HicA family toxin [Candidatus Methanoperedens sp.]|nr:type II toxin-antitoxin system HicA family toxin [Candidatus Methanoperedens sp.]
MRLPPREQPFREGLSACTDYSDFSNFFFIKVREIIKLLKADGWYLIASKGSHQQYKHPTKPGRVTIAGHPGDE